MTASRGGGAISVAGITAAGIAAGLIAYYVPLERGLFIAALAVVCAFPAVLRIAQHEFDPFEPIIIISAAIAVFFVIRPGCTSLV